MPSEQAQPKKPSESAARRVLGAEFGPGGDRAPQSRTTPSPARRQRVRAVTTRLICMHCERRAAMGQIGRKEGDVMLIFRSNITGIGWHDHNNRPDLFAVSNTENLCDWPTCWHCAHCGWDLRLDRATAQRVGHRHRVGVHAIPPANR